MSAALTGSIFGLMVGGVVTVFVAGLYFGIVLPVRYGLDKTHLIVRHGTCCQRIPFSEISDVFPTRNPLSSAALSLDRLHVRFGKGSFNAVMISPADRDHFLDDLAQRAGLKRELDRLLRT